MIDSISDLILIFFVYSVIGWCWETIYCSLKEKKFVYRGFLFGPYCPVYGFAVTTVLVLTQPFQSNLLELFLGGLLVATAFEYVAAMILEDIFHLKLWDYSQEFGNVKGRIAPRISLFWGIGILVLVKWIQPHIMVIIDRMSVNWAVVVSVIMLGDAIWTVTDTVSFRKMAMVFEERLMSERDRLKASLHQEIGDLSEETSLFNRRWEELKAHAESLLAERNIKPFRFNQRRLLKNYSRLRMPEAPLVSDWRKPLASLKRTKAKK